MTGISKDSSPGLVFVSIYAGSRRFLTVRRRAVHPRGSRCLQVLERFARGTRWSMSAPTWDVFARLVLDGQAVATRGPNFDFLACGRLFTYFAKEDGFGVDAGHYHYFAAFS